MKVKKALDASYTVLIQAADDLLDSVEVEIVDK